MRSSLTPSRLSSLLLLLSLQWDLSNATPAAAAKQGSSLRPPSLGRALPRRYDREPPRLFVTDTDSVKKPLLSIDFPDPAIVQDTDGAWYAFATSSGNVSIQVARAAAADGPWESLEEDMLPASLFSGASSDASAAGFTGSQTWAPDVRVIRNGSYVMYFSGELASNTALHCVGVATASSMLGPWTPRPSPLACPASEGGAIDPSGFLDASTGRRYVVYKVDGNSLGNGGTCGNGIAPYKATPLMLQELSPDDGYTLIGDPVELLDRTQQEDGPLIEAPDIVRIETGGAGSGGGDRTAKYVLFYSSHCYSTPGYNVNYATADSVTGPYARSGTPLLGTGNFNMTAPGGASSVDGGGYMVFHADCDAGRCLFGADFTVVGTNILVG